MDHSAPDCCNSFEDRSPGSEMIGPIVTPRIKQRDDRPCKRIGPGQVRAFAETAAVAGKGQIAVIVGAIMLPDDDMLDVVCKRTTVLRKEAVFTTIRGPAADEFPRGRIHRYWSSENWLRAFNFRIETKSAALINASYSARSSSLSNPSFARSARASILSWTGADTPKATTRRADSASRQRLRGSRN